jgi:cytochrome b subunit of formate dehydrogenase
MATIKDQKQAARAPQVIRRYIKRREALDAANRLRTSADGRRYVIRFSEGQRAEHLLLLVAFTMLAVTGLAQTYYDTAFGQFILSALGGITGTRQAHHFFAFLFGAQSIYHVALFVYELFVYQRISKIWPEWSDVTGLIQMLKLNLGLTRQAPRFDRFNFEEKAEYWALIWGTAIMGATGLMQWFPIQLTEYLPGWAIPVARAFHRWEAILAVLAIVTWHSYHAVLKKLNFSIFTGLMTVEEMEEEHPLELVYLEKAVAALRVNMWPALIEIPLAEPEAEPVTTTEPDKAESAEIVATPESIEADKVEPAEIVAALESTEAVAAGGNQ